MFGRVIRCFFGVSLLTVLCVIFGCDGGGGGGNPLPPITDITGTWEGEAKDPGVSGNYFYAIEFTFVQHDNSVSGTSSFPGLAKFNGKIDGYVLTIEGTDIYAYITSDGQGNKEIRGTFTSGGLAGGTDTVATGGQTATFWLRRISEFGLL
jgi:hypothetical protein